MTNGWTDKEVINQVLIPRLDKIEKRVEDIEEMVNQGTPWGNQQVAEMKLEMKQNLDAIRVEVSAVKQSLLTKDGVTLLFGELFKDAQARGWTPKEQMIKVVTVLAVITSLALTFYTAFHHG